MPGVHDLDPTTSSTKGVLDWCHSWYKALLADGLGRERLLSSTSNLLVRLNDKAVVKFGPATTASEAANQTFAREELLKTNSCVQVPQVYMYFENEEDNGHVIRRVGYLVMEYIDGQLLSQASSAIVATAASKISTALQLLWSITSDQPGPVDGGEPTGVIWAPDNRPYESFSNKTEMEAWFNRALEEEDTCMDLTQTPLVFCHLDVAARNVIVTEDQKVYLLDWADSGFFPRSFEAWQIEYTSWREDGQLQKILNSSIPQLDPENQKVYQMLWQALRLNTIYSWSIEKYYKDGRLIGLDDAEHIDEA